MSFARKPDMTDTPEPIRSPAELLETLRTLRAEIAAEGGEFAETWRPAIRRRAFRIGVLNLGHYLALRRRDLRRLQEALMVYGLSSLGRLESRVLPTLDAVI